MKDRLLNITFENVVKRHSKFLDFSRLDLDQLGKERILVTGAGGSIGSRIVYLLSQIAGVDYLATDRDETALHSLSLQINGTALFDNPRLYLMDIRDVEGIHETIKMFKPTIIIHAAALKHLSTLQRQPREAVLTNIFGTANLLEAAQFLGVPRFINISTDKAVYPASVLGKSKRIAEIYASTFSDSMLTNSVRFGNVFNSRGSVIETFVFQLANNRPVTLTSQTISRYFMHIDEAAQLTIKSLLLNPHDLFVFDMGEPVLLINIIENLKAIIGSTSPIIITGLRDGEKVEELLFHDFESVEELINEKIYGVELNIPEFELDSLKKIIQDRNYVKILEHLN
jgi:FlaA1/EpsC-like NDP-sugar epimerase